MRPWLAIICALCALGCGVTFRGSGEGGGGGRAMAEGGMGGNTTGLGGAGGMGGSARGSGGGEVGGAGGAMQTTCPVDLPGPALVSVLGPAGTFCIDATEVTISHYSAFLRTIPQPSTSDPLCGWKLSYAPGPPGHGDCTAEQFDEINFGDHPISCVDWCDAQAYCNWAGKRLCGGIGGHSLVFADHADPTKSEWAFVCTRGGSEPFPYGPTYQPDACVGDDYDGVQNAGNGQTEPVGSATGCVGGVAGVFDMSGNVWEWEDACDTDLTPFDDLCQHSGGSFWDGSSSLHCARDGFYSRNFRNKNFGFRCCADAR